MMRRLLGLLAALCVAALALLAAPAVVSASTPGVHAAAPVTCESGAYPPGPNATVESSTTTPFIGQKIEVSGVDYCPNEDVRLTIAGKFVGTAHTDSSGAFDPPATVPGPSGDAPLCGVGASGLPTDQDCLTLHVQVSPGGIGGVSASRGSNGGASGSGTGTGGLAFTGVQIAGLIALAVALVVGGGFFATVGRRRKSAARV